MAESRSDGNDHLTDFDDFYRKHFVQIRNYLYYKIGDWDNAQDLAQECFVKVWEKREQVNHKAALSYLFSVANNLTMNYYRHARVVLKFEGTTEQSDFLETPQYLMEEQEFNLKLQAALASLSEKQRIVFLMNRVDDLTYSAIADRLNISVKAVEKRMHGALDKLRQSINAKI